jgi:hypothetical protein
VEIEGALRVLRALSNGVDPETGEVFPSETLYQQGETVRALLLAVDAVEKMQRRQNRKTQKLEKYRKHYEWLQNRRVDYLKKRAEQPVSAQSSVSPQDTEDGHPMNCDGQKVSPRNAGNPWTEEEEQLMVSRLDQGASLGELCEFLGRTQGAIKARLVRLGIILS